MGWLIITLAIIVICAVLFYLDYQFVWDCEGIEIGGGFTCLISFCIALGLTISMVEMKSDAKVIIQDYNQVVEMTTELNVPSDAITEKILSLNETIQTHQVKSDRFMTRGLYSKEVGALPLLDIPEVMKNPPQYCGT